MLKELLEKQQISERKDFKKRDNVYKILLSSLPKELLDYDWAEVSCCAYTAGWSSLHLTLKKDDDTNIAVISGWLTSLFDDIKLSKPQIRSGGGAAYVEAYVKLHEQELRILVYCHHTGECKKVKIRKEIPAETTEARVEEEYAIICAGEELPEGAEVIVEESNVKS